MQDFIKTLADSHIYLFDGAMGTMLYNRGIFINRCFDELNLKDPELVLKVHREYVSAGAEILETNTYGANVGKLEGFGIGERLHEINLSGARLARQAAGDAACSAPMASSPAPSGPNVGCCGRWAWPVPAPCANGAATPPPSSANGISTIRSCSSARSRNNPSS